MKDLEELQSFTVEEFQEDFDNLIERVENGESFIIRDGENSAVIVPYLLYRDHGCLYWR